MGTDRVPAPGSSIVPLRARQLASRSGVPELDAVAPEFAGMAQSRTRAALMLTLCAFVLVALTMSWLGRIDIHAIAVARIQPVGRSKVVQPLQSGKVRAVHVKNGARVAVGEVLLELDPTESLADRDATAAQIDALSGEISRRRTVIANVRNTSRAVLPQIDFDRDVRPDTRQRQQALLLAEFASLHSSLRSLDAQVEERLTDKKALQMTIAEQRRLVDALQKRVEMRRSLLLENLESKVNVMQVEGELAEQTTTLVRMQGESLKADAAIQSLKREKEYLVTKTIVDNSLALVAAQTRRDELAQALIKDSAKVAYNRLTAPTAGTVEDLAVTTIGQVVTAGQQLMTIVPQELSLEAEALVLNKDIAFVEPGQSATLKLDALPFTRYGTLTGRVMRVTREAVGISRATSAASGPVSLYQAQDLVYPITIQLEAAAVTVDGRRIPLVSGMTATAEIRTGQRRVIEYFLAPVLEVVSEAGHER